MISEVEELLNSIKTRDRKRDLEDVLKNAEDLQTGLSSLEHKICDLLIAIDALREIAKTDIIDKDTKGEIQKFVAVSSGWINDLKKVTSRNTDPIKQFSQADYMDRIDERLGRFEDIYGKAWSEWRDSEFGYLLLSGSAIENISKLNRIYKKIGVIKVRLSWYKNIPIDENDKKTFQEILNERDEIIKQLQKEGINSEILDFLALAGSDAGAPLSDVNDEILKWLKTHKLSEKFSVVISGNSS